MDTVLGTGNTLFGYAFVLLIYLSLWLAMRQAMPWFASNFRRSFLVLYVVWSVGIFVGNFLFYLLGIMSFYPWLNNIIHSFLWIGLGLGFLYAISHKRPLWEQMVLFGIYSLVVKFAEQRILGTWEFSRFFFIEGNLAYLIGWSVVDALYPIGAYFVLKIASRFVTGLVVPDLKLR
ncbi:MAG: hypothetical protein IT298_06400 [Chloroflexi bacterium]|nr:MAG: hypothetical protein UZ13_01391 [Chloroflexi bacterium OLB13]MCC6565378.1 hypothetical protein [Chloroflexota bacterium]